MTTPQHALTPSSVNAASIAASAATLTAIQQEYDAFQRSDVADEIILDTHGWDAEEELLGRLTELTGINSGELSDAYLVIYHDPDLDA